MTCSRCGTPVTFGIVHRCSHGQPYTLEADAIPKAVDIIGYLSIYDDLEPHERETLIEMADRWLSVYRAAT